MKSKKFGIFNQPIVPGDKKSSTPEPWKFRPSMADQRAGISIGAGTFWGSGMKNPSGKLRESTVGYKPVTSSQVKIPPKTLA